MRYMEDRIEQAFEALRSQGIEAHQNFWCCQSCGCAAIADDSKGYVFYHAQGYDGLRSGRELCLYYGTGDGEDAGKIANEAVSELRNQGLSVEWDGKLTSAIIVNNTHPVSESLVGRFNEDEDEEDWDDEEE